MSSPSTPIRAITSTLSLRSAPSIPPPSQTYEPLVKVVLRHRLLSQIFLYSSISTWAIVSLYSSWARGGPSNLGLVGFLVNPLSPLTLIFAITTWGIGVLPVIVFRKLYLTASPTNAASPSQSFQSALKKNATSRLILTYISSAAALTVLHIVLSYACEPFGSDPRLTIFVKSRKHPYYLNGRSLFLITSQVFVACVYLLRNTLKDRTVVRWTSSLSEPSDHTSPLIPMASFITATISMSILAAFAIAAHLVLFGLSRSILLPIVYKIPILPRFIRPFSAHFLKGPMSFVVLAQNWSLVSRAFVVGFMTLLQWEFSESVFDALVAEPVVVSHSVADPALTLISGISSTDDYFKHFAFAELRQFAIDDSTSGSTRRAALFADQKYNPSMWATFARETLLLLGRDYQLFLRKGKPEPAPAKPAPTPKPAPPSAIPATPLVRASVLKPQKQSPLRSALDSLASDGAVASAVEATAVIGATHIPELFKSVSGGPDKSKATAVIPTQPTKKQNSPLAAIANAKKSLESAWVEVGKRTPKVVNDVGAQVRDWWKRERLSKVVESCLPNRKLDALAIDTLCALTSASLTEDKYGVVQRDIPRILEALLSFLSAIEEYQKELNASHPLPTMEDAQNLTPKQLAEISALSVELSKSSDALSEVGDALKDGIVKIVTTFGDRLNAFKFPPRIARKLQGFIDYH
ncbi:hypothetical protein NLI96_g9046 [Meripilus lineatus]|uniref:Nucleoporin NDC1 n=1 Tax=Meripilus lineatus TaxID=2056292 RepID=A0AAD5YAM0_9APHY|nr:hypothetical protein NLI96_g9046 [Physisporinus lineatus]